MGELKKMLLGIQEEMKNMKQKKIIIFHYVPEYFGTLQNIPEISSRQYYTMKIPGYSRAAFQVIQQEDTLSGKRYSHIVPSAVLEHPINYI